MNCKAELVIALDFQTAKEALSLARTLKGAVSWMKVGLELFTAEGPGVVAMLKDMDYRVFLDLKFHDIPNTVQGAARSAARLGADMATIHLSGGERMAKAALEGVAGEKGETKLLGISILTSTTPREAGYDSQEAVVEAVAAKALEGKTWGLPGIVCSGNEAAAVRAVCGPDMICLCPGIRMESAGDDQRRIMTPAMAVAAGADFLVMGRPITRAADPRGAAMAALENMAGA